MAYRISFDDEDYIVDVSYDYSPMRKNTFTEKKVVELEGREYYQAVDKKAKELGLSFGRRPQLTEEERMVEKEFEYKILFKKGQSLETKKGVNILVGDNGCGKSSLIKLLIEKMKSTKYIFVDLEKSNPKISKPAPANGVDYTVDEVVNQFMWAAESHGETREGVLKAILTLDFDVLILDEPEQGLSMKNQRKYIRELKNMNKDIIIVTHSKIFVEEVDEVFDVEKMEWIKTEDYLKYV